MRVNVAIPEAHVSRPVLDASLEAVTRLNETLLQKGVVPPFRQAVDKVRWKPEPPGDEHFDHAAVVLGRGWGDCDDLAPWHAASLRATGEDPEATAFVRKSGPSRWHAVVRRGDGSVDDPSREAGMGQRTNGVLGGALPLMMRPNSVVGEVGTFLVRPQLALRPVLDRAGQAEAWQARADLPWHWVPGKSPHDVAMVSLHASPVSSQAVVGACQGLIDLGEANDVDDEILDRAAAISDACEGASYEDLCDEYGPEHAQAAGQVVGSFFGGLKRSFKRAGRVIRRGAGSAFKVATMPLNLARGVVKFIPGVGPVVSNITDPRNLMKMAPMAANFIPGVGPLASMALEHASPILQRSIMSHAHLPHHVHHPLMHHPHVRRRLTPAELEYLIHHAYGR